MAVWVGYDNADGKRRTLGRGQTGGKIAIPIFEPIIEAAWDAPRSEDRLGSAVPRGGPPTDRAADRRATGDRITDGPGRASRSISA